MVRQRLAVTDTLHRLSHCSLELYRSRNDLDAVFHAVRRCKSWFRSACQRPRRRTSSCWSASRKPQCCPSNIRQADNTWRCCCWHVLLQVACLCCNDEWADCLLRRLQCSGTLLRPGHDLQYLQLQRFQQMSSTCPRSSRLDC